MTSLEDEESVIVINSDSSSDEEGQEGDSDVVSHQENVLQTNELNTSRRRRRRLRRPWETSADIVQNASNDEEQEITGFWQAFNSFIYGRSHTVEELPTPIPSLDSTIIDLTEASLTPRRAQQVNDVNSGNSFNIDESTTPGDVIVVGIPSHLPKDERKRKRKLKAASAISTKNSENGLACSDGNVAVENSDTLEQMRQRLKCAICLDKMQAMSSTTCGHLFCKACIRQAVQTAHQCPLCKKRLSLRDIHPIYF